MQPNLTLPNMTTASVVACQGEYQVPLNVFFIVCTDSMGVIQESDTKFYEYSLEKQCGQAIYSDIKGEIDSAKLKWNIPADLADDTQLNFCDYFERGVGY